MHVCTVFINKNSNFLNCSSLSVFSTVLSVFQFTNFVCREYYVLSLCTLIQYNYAYTLCKPFMGLTAFHTN